MAHEDFDSDINILLDEFGAAAELMLDIVAMYIEGSLTAPDAEANIETVGETLRGNARAWTADVMTRAYVDGMAEALSADPETNTVPQQDHAAMQGLAQRRLERRLVHAIDGLVVDALDRLDEALEGSLAPLTATQ